MLGALFDQAAEESLSSRLLVSRIDVVDQIYDVVHLPARQKKSAWEEKSGKREERQRAFRPANHYDY